MAAKKKRDRPEITFDYACDALMRALDGPARREVVDGLVRTGRLRESLERLRAAMREHAFRAGDETVHLARVVRQLDRKTRTEGFHVLHDWDGIAERLNEDMIPVDVLTFLMDKSTPAGREASILAILLDYYFLYVLSLLSLRAWDDGDPDASFARLDALVERLQGPDGSGHRFVDDPETLVHLATSHFEAEDASYDALLERARKLGAMRRCRMALSHAGILACHLRFGFEATYGRDLVKTRDDNVADYPWLLFALSTLLEAVDAEPPPGAPAYRERLLEGLLNGLSPDPRAFVGKMPELLSPLADELERFRERFLSERDRLLDAMKVCEPEADGYSPLGFHFNFVHNVLKAMVVDALLRGEPGA